VVGLDIGIGHESPQARVADRFGSRVSTATEANCHATGRFKIDPNWGDRVPELHPLRVDSAADSRIVPRETQFVNSRVGAGCS
jgi:hypothetical protein